MTDLRPLWFDAWQKSALVHQMAEMPFMQPPSSMRDAVQSITATVLVSRKGLGCHLAQAV